MRFTSSPRCATCIGLAEIDKLVVEGGAHSTIRVVIAKGSGAGGAVELREPYQLHAKADELIDRARQIIDPATLGLDDVLLPLFGDRIDFIKVTQQVFCERRGLFPIGRHVDAARFHDHGINEPIEAGEGLRPSPGSIHLLAGLPARCKIIGMQRDAKNRGESEETNDQKQSCLERKLHSTLVPSAGLMAREISALRYFMRLQVHPGP